MGSDQLDPEITSSGTHEAICNIENKIVIENMQKKHSICFTISLCTHLPFLRDTLSESYMSLQLNESRYRTNELKVFPFHRIRNIKEEYMLHL